MSTFRTPGSLLVRRWADFFFLLATSQVTTAEVAAKEAITTMVSLEATLLLIEIETMATNHDLPWITPLLIEV